MSLFDKLLGGVHPAMNAAQQYEKDYAELLQKQMLGQMQGIACTSDNLNISNAGTFAYAPSPHKAPLRRLTMDDLTGEAATASLDHLANLWRARWGTKWVLRGEIDGEFYNIAAARLAATHRLEGHQLADGTQVYRLIEGP